MPCKYLSSNPAVRQFRRRPERSGVTHEVGDDLVDGLAAFGRDPLEARCVLPLNADDNRHLPARARLDRLYVAWINGGQLIVEVAGLGVWGCPGICCHVNLREAYARGQSPPSLMGCSNRSFERDLYQHRRAVADRVFT